MGEIGTTFSGLTGKSKDDFGHGKAKYITYLNVYSNCLTSDKTLDLIEIDNTQNQVQKGDVFFTTSSETPDEIGLSSVWTYDIPNVYLNSFCFGYRPDEKIDLNYLAYMLRSESVRNQMILLAQGISRYNISKKSVMEIDVYLPKLEEQTAIGNFFKQLDDTITLHQRQTEEYQKLKTGFLESVFCTNSSQNNSKNTNTWEQRKLGEITENLDNQRIPVAESLRKTGTTPYYGANGIQGYIDGFTHNGEFVLIAEDGANDLQNYPVQYVTGKVWVNNHAHVVAGKINTLDNLFLTYRIKSMDISRFLVGGGRAKLNASTMKEIEIKYPTLPEQTAIGNLFKQLDETIALHQRKIEKYQFIKQLYLEKMFIK